MMEVMTTTERPYRMGKRLDDVEETRQRIVEATVELHGSVGPAATTISAVAERAGVQRSTVYRHFPDEEALFGACTSHWMARNPWPKVERWKDEADPATRLRLGLTELYGYYDRNRDMLSNSHRDLAVMPAFVGEMMRAFVTEAERALGAGWGDGDRQAQWAIAHAVDFRSWQTLDEQGAAPDEAASLMAAMVAGLRA
jgi:AcrR family transcriptional regulator